MANGENQVNADAPDELASGPEHAQIKNSELQRRSGQNSHCLGDLQGFFFSFEKKPAMTRAAAIPSEEPLICSGESPPAAPDGRSRRGRGQFLRLTGRQEGKKERQSEEPRRPAEVLLGPANRTSPSRGSSAEGLALR